MPWQAVACQTTRKVLQSVLSALREAVEPGDFLQHSLPAVKPRAQSESKKPENLAALVALFKEMNY